jgi:hypothetical protein
MPHRNIQSVLIKGLWDRLARAADKPEAYRLRIISYLTEELA